MVLPSGKYSIELSNKQIIWRVWGIVHTLPHDMTGQQGLGPMVPWAAKISSPGPIEFVWTMEYSVREGLLPVLPGRVLSRAGGLLQWLGIGVIILLKEMGHDR
jgi:hypothetical protein